jgi:hypothetical protein
MTNRRNNVQGTTSGEPQERGSAYGGGGGLLQSPSRIGRGRGHLPGCRRSWLELLFPVAVPLGRIPYFTGPSRTPSPASDLRCWVSFRGISWSQADLCRSTLSPSSERRRSAHDDIWHCCLQFFSRVFTLLCFFLHRLQTEVSLHMQFLQNSATNYYTWSLCLVNSAKLVNKSSKYYICIFIIKNTFQLHIIR